jgi:hypothetical protein
MSKSVEDLQLVPDGHSVEVHSAALEPSVYLTAGGVLMAQLGVSGDEPCSAIEALIDRVDALLDSTPQCAIVSLARGSIDVLFAPSNPEVVVVERAVVFVMFAGSLNGSLGDADALQRLTHRLDAIGKKSGAPLTVFLGEGAGTPSDLLLNVLRGLGTTLRRPDDEGAVLVEVSRPEGVTICAHLGVDLGDESGLIDASWHALNVERAAAIASGDATTRVNIDDRENALFTRWIAEQEAKTGPRAPMIARHLNRALLAFASERDSASWAALNDTLLHRDFPLFLMVDPKTRGLFQREWPGLGRGIAVYPDRLSLLWAADDMGLKEGTFGVAVIPTRDLFGWAASSNLALAINVFASRSKPSYLPWTPPQVKTMADGRAPIMSFSR